MEGKKEHGDPGEKQSLLLEKPGKSKTGLETYWFIPPSSDQSDIFVPRKEGDKLQKNENPGEGKAGL